MRNDGRIHATSKVMMRKLFYGLEIGITVLLTVASVGFSFVDRNLDQVSESLLDGFRKALGIADGIVLGISLSMIVLRIIQFILRRQSRVLVGIEDIAGIFSAYALLAGLIVGLFAPESMTTYQILTYVFVTLGNLHLAVRYFRRGKMVGDT